MGDNNKDSITQKLRELTEKETPQSLANFWQTLKFKLSQTKDYAQFLDSSWQPHSVLNRGLLPTKDRDDVVTVTGEHKKLALDMMLGSICTRIPVISGRFITHQATSLQHILNRLRLHYGFNKTGARICDLVLILMDHTDSHETVWERLCAFVDDNLLDPTEEISHEGALPDTLESLSPTLLNVMVVLWLQIVHPSLPGLVKERFTRELRNQTLYSIREEISTAIPTLIAQQGGTPLVSQTFGRGRSQPQRQTQTTNKVKTCWLCIALGKQMSFPHFYRECPELPLLKRYAKTRRVQVDSVESTEEYGPPVTPLLDDTTDPDCDEPHTATLQMISLNQAPSSTITRIDIESSPTLVALVNGKQVVFTLDSGAESNLLSRSEATRLGLHIEPTNHGAHMADGSSRLRTIGEVHFTAKCGHHTLSFGGLVAENLNCSILAGMPFHKKNDVYSRPGRNVVHIGECCQFQYGPQCKNTIPQPRMSHILRVETSITLFPGESLPLTIPPEFQATGKVAIEPRPDAPSLRSCTSSRLWFQPSVEQISETHQVYVTNTSTNPIRVGRHEQICNVRHVEDAPDVTSIEAYSVVDPPVVSFVAPVISPQLTQVNEMSPLTTPMPPPGSKFFSDAVSVDPDHLVSTDLRQKIVDINRKYDSVFDPTSIGCYNGASGPFKAHVNVGKTIPPQRKGVLPSYPHTDKVRLQQNCDELESHSVLAKPEDLGIHVEHVNTTFLVGKEDGGDRVITSFGEVAQYCRPQPSLLPNTDETIRTIGRWRFVIKTDLSKAYRQIPLTRASLKYCGICTPFKGIRCYTRCAMGMPGSETALEELLCRVLGDIIMTGKAAKVADDLYCGGDTAEEALHIWSLILEALARNGLRLSARKTVIFPASTVILGWIWNQGTLETSPHRRSALETCDLPVTVRGLRGFIGAYSFLHRVIPGCSVALAPLHSLTAKKSSTEKIEWNGVSITAFRDAQKHLSTAKAITLPRPNDQLQIQTDGSVSKFGLGATLFVVRQGRTHLGGFFSAKLRDTQLRWMPCELEALGISMAIRHFAPYIIESRHRTAVFTDSRPCVQAYSKFCQGRFSSSMRVSTFLSALCDYGVTLQHVPGPQNLLADFSSRDPPECDNQSCQLCKFVLDTANSVVRAMTVQEALSDSSITPFANRAAWIGIQHSCPQLESVRRHLSLGTRPLKKRKNVEDIRRYCHKVVVAQDGLLVVEQTTPFIGRRERIVVPRKIVFGLVTALHLRLQHPTKTELTKIFARQFFALDSDKVISSVVGHCDICSSLSSVPALFKEQSTSTNPTVVGCDYSADVIRRYRQCILVLREKSTSLTATMLITNETADILRQGVISLCARFRNMSNLPCSIRVDPAPGFQALKNDVHLRSLGITLELGDEKNPNKNPVCEKANRELHGEFRKIQPMGGPMSESTLATATGILNSRLRYNGLSATEMWTRRDQYSGSDLPIQDRELLRSRLSNRNASHRPSAKYKARGRTSATPPELEVGDLIYLIQDYDKTKARDRYIIVEQDNSDVFVKKFSGCTLRDKRYRVKPIDCLPIHPTTVEAALADPQLSDDSDLEMDDLHPTHDRAQPPLPAQAQPGIAPDNANNEHVGIDFPPASPAREQRPPRNRRAPILLDDYVSGSEFDDEF